MENMVDEDCVGEEIVINMDDGTTIKCVVTGIFSNGFSAKRVE